MYNQEKCENHTCTGAKSLIVKKKMADFYSNICIYIILFTYICVKAHRQVIEYILKDTCINIDMQNQEKREKTHAPDENLKFLKPFFAFFHSNIYFYIILFIYICVKTHRQVIKCIIKDTYINIDMQNQEKREKIHATDQNLRFLKQFFAFFSW